MEQGLQPQMVRPHLYISSMRTELYRELLESNGITHILQVGIELQPSHPQHFQYLQLPIADWPEQDIVSSFPAAFDFIDAGMDGGGGVLVHCQAGISRSASFVIAYCMWKERLSADAATAVVAAARSAIFPNMGFKTQLREFERLGWDASRWQGWSMSQFLATRYGGESVDFMAAMLGGAPETSGVVRGSSRGQQPAPSTDMYGQRAPVADSPFAQYRAAISKANGSGSSGARGSTQQRAYQQQQAAADSLRSRGCSADQRPGSRGSSKSPALASASPEVRSARASWSDAASNGASSRPGPSSTRRASHACYCGKCGVGAGVEAPEAGSSSGSRQRRHSTGQQYAQLAAAAGAAAMTHMSLMSLNARACLPEEAALLMAG